ncbi:MAG: phage tail tape measure protein [Candidatus Competibacteraceae bacterium]|nr:phage tail tape measure protein [Candidatus Competibacteraceae bacterium]
MASPRNLALQFVIKAKDSATGVFKALFGYLDSEISVTAGKVRDAFSNLFGGGLDGAIEFEAQLDKVQAKGGYTAESMEQLKKAAVDVGAKLGLTGTEAAQGMESLAAAGLNATQVMQALPPVLALAKAEGISMDAAAEKLSDSLSIMGLGFEQAGTMADVLAKGANVSTTSASALAQALSTAGGIAKTAGLNLEQTVAALSALANAGIKGERAGTALAAILTQLTNPASAASKELSALGITTRDLGEVVGQLAAKGDASNAAILAFGETAGPGLRALIGQGQQSLLDLTGQLNNADGAAQQAADGIGGNLKGALTALQSTWDNIKTALLEPVLQPLTEAANEAAASLNAGLNEGALKPVQGAIKAFATNTIQAVRDFIGSFDFASSKQAVDEFAKDAEAAFGKIGSAGRAAGDVVTIAWNAVTAGFRTVGSALLAVAASAVQTLANMEEVASKIGLGTQQRANELRETANGLQAKATELIDQVATDGRELQAAYDRLTTSTDGAAAANQRLKDSLPAAELQTINKSLADYAAIAERANLAAQQAQKDFFAGKISMEQLAAAADAAAATTDALVEATRRNAEQQAAAAAAGQKAAAQHKATAVELQAVATASQDAADQQGKYTGALEQASNANSEAIRAELDLALAKGDVATAAAKSVQLAQSEVDWARRIADAKATEAAELQKVVVAQQAYLAAVGGGTAAQQQELQILQLKVGALQAEAAQAGATAETKALAAQQTQQNTEQTKESTAETEHHIVALKKDSEEQQVNTKHTNDGSVAAAGLANRLQELRGEMDKLSESARLYFEAQNQWNLARVGIEGSAKAARDAEAAFQNLGDSAGKALAGYNKEIAFAQEGIDRWKDKLGFATTGFEKFESSMELAALQTKKLWNEQARDAEIARQSIERMTESGNIQMGVLKQAIQGVNGGFTLLDQQDLSNLQSAIDAANDKLREMQAEASVARDEIARLNAEIAAERGDTEKAALLRQQLDYQKALAEIEAKRNQAELEGNGQLVALYDEQIRKLTELNALKEKNIKADADAARQQAANNNSATALPGGTGAAALPSASGTSARTYTLNLTGVNGRTLPATTNTDPASFLDELERAQARSLR